MFLGLIHSEQGHIPHASEQDYIPYFIVRQQNNVHRASILRLWKGMLSQRLWKGMLSLRGSLRVASARASKDSANSDIYYVPNQFL